MADGDQGPKRGREGFLFSPAEALIDLFRTPRQSAFQTAQIFVGLVGERGCVAAPLPELIKQELKQRAERQQRLNRRRAERLAQLERQVRELMKLLER